jgi:hypothetical protein
VLKVLKTIARLSVVFALAVTACSRTEPDPNAAQNRELLDIFLIAKHYGRNHPQPPAELKDFQRYEASNYAGYRALAEGRHIFAWGVPNQGSSTVLAYEKDTPEQGGLVLLGDGTTRKMSPQEFQAATAR